ncbi:MAG: 23S rRNA (adenine(2030)-N(6))-methyltransferase RlmJ [Gammaproteobacteria bacterium]|nr:23S rRNA (adenine(2030)-N(6))-methyltransferase RlmJ [Gammaproteobacteria bacterium]
MLSYLHSYHAGNFADVVKHVTLVGLLQAILRKDTPCYVHDSHAGRGLYHFSSRESLQGREFENGIGRLWQVQQAPELIQQYLALVQRYNTKPGELLHYPGSPAIAQAMLRQTDRLLLTELHPMEYERLVKQFSPDRRIRIDQQDAYQGLKAFLPPAERRGLVLIDPAYERKDEYEHVITGLIQAHKRWANGIYVIWYPVMSRALQARFIEACKAADIPKMLHAEFMTKAFSYSLDFVGCGVVIVNPPWKLDKTLEENLDWLLPVLQQGPGARTRVQWIVPE